MGYIHCEVEAVSEVAVVNEDNLQQQEPQGNKNLEIRRMSATEDGDKVLQSAWDSPEKAGLLFKQNILKLSFYDFEDL